MFGRGRTGRAAQGLVDAVEVLRHAGNRERHALEQRRDHDLEELNAQLAEEAGELWEKHADETARRRRALEDAVAGMRASLGPDSEVDVAEFVRLGEAKLIANLVDGDSSPAIPVWVPLLDHGNLVINSSWSDKVAVIIRSMITQILTGSGPGQVRIRSVDPSVRSTLAPFSPLADVHDELLMPPATSETEVESMLHDVLADVRATVDMFQGRPITLGQMRREIGQPIGSYQILIVADYPAGFSRRARDSLINIMRAGPAAGVSTIVHMDSNVTSASEPAGVEAILGMAELVTVDGETVQTSWLPGWVTALDPEPDLTTTVPELAERTRGAKAPQIDFLDCQPERELMSDVSTHRLTATIGRAGQRPVTITLGDEIDQRHNILVSGAVGQGKSNLLMVLIHSLAMRYPPSELEMHLLDFKEGVTLEPLGARTSRPSWLPHAASIGLNSDRSYGAAALAHLVAEFERRAALMRGHGDNITKYRLADTNHRMPRIVVVIDEFQVLFDTDDGISERALADLERLARKGRAYGIHLVLASQTLSGITSMLTKQDGIFAQFPIRLALKNSAAESRAVLDQNNTAAARLRYRGELLVNLDFGDADANRRATVCWADDGQLAELRRRICSRLDTEDRRLPVTFDGAHAPSLRDAATQVRRLRDERGTASPRVALLGTTVDVRSAPAGFSLTDDNGRHLAVVGAGAPRIGSGSSIAENQAVGALQAAAMSLAAQSRNDGTQISVIDLLPEEVSKACNMTEFTSTLESSGVTIAQYAGRSVNDYLRSLKDIVDSRNPGDPPLYVVAFGLDRARQFRHIDMASGASAAPADGVHALLRDGPPVGAHLLAWWSSVRVMNEHLGLEASGTIDGVLALRITSSDAQDLFGPFTEWKPDGPRALFHDRVETSEPEVIVPFRPLERFDTDAVREVVAQH